MKKYILLGIMMLTGDMNLISMEPQRTYVMDRCNCLYCEKINQQPVNQENQVNTNARTPRYATESDGDEILRQLHASSKARNLIRQKGRRFQLISHQLDREVVG